jgi:hypothetical protein
MRIRPCTGGDKIALVDGATVAQLDAQARHRARLHPKNVFDTSECGADGRRARGKAILAGLAHVLFLRPCENVVLWRMPSSMHVQYARPASAA